ncbi:hypothetical protein P7L91_03390 [Bisgaard Taxon 10/6]|uniref:hypothetical protein n=1 Tax=Exercitatus varius TaxID=67857 RepID=UPI00294AAF8A|nr:hypothetical protein [Exercitatus varius]MDG2959886.1 hypothetical protein [Exercitatus varius]
MLKFIDTLFLVFAWLLMTVAGLAMLSVGLYYYPLMTAVLFGLLLLAPVLIAADKYLANINMPASAPKWLQARHGALTNIQQTLWCAAETELKKAHH